VVQYYVIPTINYILEHIYIDYRTFFRHYKNSNNK